MINISTNKQLNIILTNTNKALAQIIKSSSPKELEALSQNKDLKSIINSMFEQTSKNSSSDKALLELVKNNPTLKNLSDISTTINELLNTLKSDKNMLPIEKTLKGFLINIKDLDENTLKQKLENSGIFLESKLKNAQNPQLKLKTTLKTLFNMLEGSKVFNAKSILQDIKNILQTSVLQNASNEILAQPQNENTKVLEQLTKNIQKLIQKIEVHLKEPPKSDPIFSKESIKLLDKLSTLNTPEKLTSQHNIKKIISNDLKSILLKTSEELTNSSNPNQHEITKHIDKLLLTVDYQQLLSHLSNSSAIYLPFSWEQLENGNINIKKDKKDRFYCDIELQLKEYGELTLKLVLYDKNQLNFHIYSDNQKFKELVKQNIPKLRSALIDTQITPREIRLFTKTKSNSNSPYKTNEKPIDMGFEVKV